MLSLRGISAVLMIAAMVWVAPPAASADPDSSSYQIDPAHDGSITFATRFAPPFKMRWSVDFGGQVSYPVVAGNLVFVIADGAIGPHMAALDITTGKPVWQKIINGDVSTSYLACDSGVLVLSTNDGPLQAFSATTGKPLWASALHPASFFNFVPVATAGYVYATGDGSGAEIFGVAADTGSVAWSHEFPSGTNGVSLAGNNVIFTAGCEVAALQPTTGKQIWDTDPGCSSPGGAPAVYFAGKVYVGGGAGDGGLVVNATTGKLIGTLQGSPPAFYKRTSYGISQGSLVALDIESGNPAWFFRPADTFSNPPIVVNNYVFSLSDTGKLYINNGTTGALVQSFNIGLGSLSQIVAAPATGLGAGQGTVFVPSGSILAAFGP